jgi:hypothetical protein
MLTQMPLDTTDDNALRRSLMQSTVEMTERLKQLLNTPGITEKVRKQAERALKTQERHTKQMERLLGLSSPPPFLPVPKRRG